MTTNNFDATELAKFEALAHRWWDRHSEFWPLHELNPVRLEWIDGLAGLSGKAVLDVGCGGGILAESMANRGGVVTGIDLAGKPLEVARHHAKATGTNLIYRSVSAEDLALEAPGSFDVVTCMEMLEHVPEPGKVVEACARLVKPGGWVFFSTINRNPWAWLIAIFGAETVLRILPKGTHDYARFIKPEELLRFADEAGLQLVEKKGMTFRLIKRTFRLNDSMSVDYLFAMKMSVNK